MCKPFLAIGDMVYVGQIEPQGRIVRSHSIGRHTFYLVEFYSNCMCWYPTAAVRKREARVSHISSSHARCMRHMARHASELVEVARFSGRKDHGSVERNVVEKSLSRGAPSGSLPANADPERLPTQSSSPLTQARDTLIAA